MRGTVTKRVLSCVLLVSMLMGMVPSAAFAQETSTPVPEHEHNKDGWVCTAKEVLTCENEEEDHEHNDTCYTELWTCQAPTDIVNLTVEYFATVDNKAIRVAESYVASLKNGSAYSVTFPDLTGQGYDVDLDNILLKTADGDELVPADEVENNTLSGELVKDLHYVVNYSYTDPDAKYTVNYWGYDVKGENEVLLYAYDGTGEKDKPVTPDKDIDGLMQSMFDALNADANVGTTDSVQALKEKYSYDITPFLKTIAQSVGQNVDGLTGLDVMDYLAANLAKKYTLDERRNAEEQLSFTVTADGKAKKNVYCITGGGLQYPLHNGRC